MLFIPGSIRGDLPTISGDFSHVAWLQINGRNGTTHLNGFLNNFPGLLHLELQDFSMPGLPESITSMPALRLSLDELGVDRMCQDAWRWQSTNPNGY